MSASSAVVRCLRTSQQTPWTRLTQIAPTARVRRLARTSRPSRYIPKEETLAISTTARMRALCVIACFSGAVLSVCALEREAKAGVGEASRLGSTILVKTTVRNTFDARSLAAPAPPTSPATTASTTFPTAPIAVRKNEVVALNSTASPYFLVVPDAYDESHNTPTQLFIWLHGCGGQAANDARVVSPGGSQSWLTVSVGGRDGGCWNAGNDASLVLAALDDVTQHLNVDPRRVTIGGYSSGGNLAYRTAFYNAGRFAGILAENTAPFYGTGSSQSASLAAAAWKLNVAHLAHTGDMTYPIANIRNETNALEAAGFAETLLERAGSHWDSDTASSGTNYDLRTYLLPFLDAGWRSPG
jgi:predicted esterase